jgi:hypothetical protein
MTNENTTEADNLLRDHAARLRVARAARQLDNVLRQIKPEVVAAINTIGVEAHEAADAIASISHSAEVLKGVANFLINVSPLLSHDAREAEIAVKLEHAALFQDQFRPVAGAQS